MGGPPPVRLIQVPHWAVLTPRMALRAAGFGGPRLGTDDNPLSLERAAALFTEMRSQAHIPFQFPQSYCSARAHEMRRLLALQNVECRKVFFEATIGYSIRAEHPVRGTITWSYHVAPTVAVQTPQGIVRMVIDPSLFDRPVTIPEWQGVMSCAKAVLTETPGNVYQPGDGRDDDYSQTQRLLEEARLAAEAERLAREQGVEPPPRPVTPPPPPFNPPAPPFVADDALADGIVPTEDSSEEEEEASWEDDGIVPGADSADDDDDIERPA